MDDPFHRLQGAGVALALTCSVGLAPASLFAQSLPRIDVLIDADVLDDEIVLAGQLVAVDLNQGVLVVVDGSGTQIRLSYDALTEVDSLYEGVAGLAGQPNLWLRIQARLEDSQAIAERIEIADGRLRGEPLDAGNDRVID